MKLKIIVLSLLLVLTCSIFAGCEKAPDRIAINENDTSRFQYIGKDKITQNGNGDAGDLIQYYVDNETSVVYIVIIIINRAGNSTWAGFAPLIDTDGTYTTYEEFINQK